MGGRKAGAGFTHLFPTSIEVKLTFYRCGSLRRTVYLFDTLTYCKMMTAMALANISITHHMLLSHFSRFRLCATPETAAHQAPRPWDSPGKNAGVGCHFLLQCMKVKSESEVTQLCPTLQDPMDCSLPGSSVHGVF